jgi:hypothetical protein
MDGNNFIGGTVRIGAIDARPDSLAAESGTPAVSIACHENEVPAFVEAELERLYGNIFSTLVHFRTYGGLPTDLSTYVVRKNNVIVTLLLFRRHDGRLDVINEGITIEEEDVRRFAEYVFGTFSTVNVISFHAANVGKVKLRFPFQRFNCSEDIVVSLPESAQEYLARLGKSTRNYIQRYEKKLRRRFPSFAFKVYEGNEINEQDLRDIVRLNRIRMAGKDKVSSNDDEEMARIIALSKASGLVGVATIDGRVCAGVINYRAGANCFMPVIAHDPEYNDYRIGTIGCYLTICECIKRGCKEYHFLWGRYGYKYRLGGVQRDLDHLAIYRSRLQFLLHARMALKLAFDGYGRQARKWLQSTAAAPGEGGFLTKAIRSVIDCLRNLKRLSGRELR